MPSPFGTTPPLLPRPFSDDAVRDVTALLFTGSVHPGPTRAEHEIEAIQYAVQSLAQVAGSILLVVATSRWGAIAARCKEISIKGAFASVPIDETLSRHDVLPGLLAQVHTPLVLVKDLVQGPISLLDLQRLVAASQRLPAVALYSLGLPSDELPALKQASAVPWPVVKVQTPYVVRTDLLKRACLWSKAPGTAEEGFVTMMRRVDCRVHLIEASALAESNASLRLS